MLVYSMVQLNVNLYWKKKEIVVVTGKNQRPLGGFHSLTVTSLNEKYFYFLDSCYTESSKMVQELVGLTFSLVPSGWGNYELNKVVLLLVKWYR